MSDTTEQRKKAIDSLFDLSGHLGLTLEEVTDMFDQVIIELTNAGVRGAAAGKLLRQTIIKMEAKQNERHEKSQTGN